MILFRVQCLVAALVLWATLAFAQIGPLPGMGPSFFFKPIAPIGSPASLGTFGTGSNTTDTAKLTTTANINSGDLAVVCVLANSTGPSLTISSMSDGTNTYSKATSIFFGGGQFTSLNLWYKGNAAAVASGATITATYTSIIQTVVITAWNVKGLLSSPLDKTASGVGTTGATSATASTGTLSQANEIVAGCAGTYGSQAYSGASGFTNINSRLFNYFAASDYDLVASTTSVSYTPTWASYANSEPIALVASFKGH